MTGTDRSIDRLRRAGRAMWPGCPALIVIGMAVAVLTVSGCGGGAAVAPVGRADPSPGAGTHRVLAGETLYAISWRYGLDYRDLARWNGIGEPFIIVVDQTLRLSRPAVLPPVVASRERATRSPSRPAPSRRTSPPPPPTGDVAQIPVKERPAVPSTKAEPEDRAVSAWRWPAKGTVVGRFGAQGGKGIDIEGRSGTPVVASAPGRVVYSGSGLRGYGKLIIVKHNKRYLSAYAHNERLHVKEGDTVSSGQRIADMGSTGTRTVKLHFEIRRDGKPVDPTRYLPR